MSGMLWIIIVGFAAGIIAQMLLASPSLTSVRDGAARDRPVPDEQHHQRADGRSDEAGALMRAVMARRARTTRPDSS